MATFISHSSSETQAFAKQLGDTLSPGWVIGLVGDLGAGKTQFVKGLANGLGIEERIHSPTFALLNTYDGGRVPLFHLDFYRLETHEQIVAAGLDDYIPSSVGITIVEWIDRWQGQQPTHFLRFELETIDENCRRIIYEDPGP